MLHLSVVELRRRRREVWSQSSTSVYSSSATCQLGSSRLTIPTLCLLPFRFCTEPVMAVACIEVQWSLSWNNSSFFSNVLSEQVNTVWLGYKKDFSYKRRNRCFSCNPLTQVTASLEAVLQNKHTHWYSSSRLCCHKSLDPALLLGRTMCCQHWLWLSDSCTHCLLKEPHLSLLQMMHSISNASNIGYPCTDMSLASFCVAQNRPKSKWCLNCQWEPDFAQLSILLTPVKLNQC